MLVKRITPRWHDGRTVIVAAPGPSLTPEVSERCRNLTVLAVKEAYRMVPWAEVLYGCDARFWDRNGGCHDFKGEKWSSHGSNRGADDKRTAAIKYGLHLIQGRGGKTFSVDPGVIHYGSNSGFQALNLTILFGATNIVLVGFDMRPKDGKRYFFGDHPTQKGFRGYTQFIPNFAEAARHLPSSIRIVNATPDSALRCFTLVSLDDALAPDPRH